MNEDEHKASQRGLIKVLAGIVFIVTGIFGFVVGRSGKGVLVRIMIYALSAISIYAGVYLLVEGLDDMAIGSVGTYKVGGTAIQKMIYDSPDHFEENLRVSLLPTFDGGKQGTVKKKTRRLHFVCPDESRKFTVYYTGVGLLGIPSDDFVCRDGFKLLNYTSGKTAEK